MENYSFKYKIVLIVFVTYPLIYYCTCSHYVTIRSNKTVSCLLFLGHVEGTNVITESENENTNPTPQDGDSNFVSNDSTSQEPILDENTTQTTSTDDGEEVAEGTPLGSDSESNIEPPTVVKAIKNSSLQLKEANIATIPTAPNGNGVLIPASAAGLEGENSSSNCLRESEYEDDESSNSRALDDTQTPSLINHSATDNDSSTLSGTCAAAATIVGQKRALNCADEASLDDSAQPEMKKIRSD